ncbi:MAG: tRNA 4-thiouridine(8) synthase ThiI [Candidatus Methanosuratincola sp.]
MKGLAEKAVYLISGGMDSPVAAYLGVMRGWAPVYVYFDNRPFSGGRELEKATALARRVVEATGVQGEMVVVPHGKDLGLIVNRCRRNLSCLLCKRLMYRKAESVAKAYGCRAIVTGEIVGEQASQTMHNLILNSSVVTMPIVRPLLGLNKTEVEGIAKRIGSYEISAMKSEGCSAAAVKARTLAKKAEIELEESILPIADLVESGVREARSIRLP